VLDSVSGGAVIGNRNTSRVVILANDWIASSTGGSQPVYEEIIEVTLRLLIPISQTGAEGSNDRTKWAANLAANLASLLAVPASRFQLKTVTSVANYVWPTHHSLACLPTCHSRRI
jgi:hypothetical protein